jgi:hypothetical protein
MPSSFRRDLIFLIYSIEQVHPQSHVDFLLPILNPERLPAPATIYPIYREFPLAMGVLISIYRRR